MGTHLATSSIQMAALVELDSVVQTVRSYQVSIIDWNLVFTQSDEWQTRSI